MLLARSRTLFLPAFLLALATLAGSALLGSRLDLSPCPLCMSQRFLLGGYALICLAALVHSPDRRGLRRYALTAIGVALAGALLAARHVWLQGELWAAPEAVVSPFEGAGHPWLLAATRMLLGSRECISTSWSFIDLTLPEWSLMAFLLLALLPLSCVFPSRLRKAADA